MDTLSPFHYFYRFIKRAHFPLTFLMQSRTSVSANGEVFGLGSQGIEVAPCSSKRNPQAKEAFTMNTMLFTTTVLIAIGIILALLRIWNS
jgi:hypothetical protein